MSSQLETMLMEEAALKHELDHLENAEDITAVCFIKGHFFVSPF
jgi:hypothetical protein